MEPIKVWKFADAPPELRALSTDENDKGKEEYVAVLPKEYVNANGMPMFLNSATIGIREVKFLNKNDKEFVLLGIRV
jgi:hypothetical protein